MQFNWNLVTCVEFKSRHVFLASDIYYALLPFPSVYICWGRVGYLMLSVQVFLGHCMLHVFDFDVVDFAILTHLPYVYQSYFDVWYFSTTPPTRKFFKLTICLSIQSLKTRILTACVSNMTFKKFETVLFMKILFNLQGAFNRFELLNCKNKKTPISF